VESRQDQSTAYQWSCQACGASNAPAVACAKCRFPAVANAEEIELAKSQGVDAVYQKRETNKKAKAEWMAQPLWRKIGDLFAFSLLVVGFILGRFAGPIEYNALGVFLVVLSFIWLWLAHRQQPERK
jgi:hypothetical protein